VSDPSQSAELLQLREQLAALTRRVYQLEQTRAAQPLASTDVPTPQGQAPPVPEPPSESQAVPPFAAPQENQGVPRVLQGSWPTAPTVPPPGPKPSADTSLESRVGGQLLNRIGIIAVLVGLSYFLKLAFDNGWIGPPAQVIIGLLAGVGLLFWSERFRAKNYVAFAYSLKALGFGALYLSLWAASQYYHLIPPTVAFFGMCVVTLVSAALSLRQNSELLAAFALAGGFLTPILVSTGENHEIALFSYVALLDLGTLWLVAIRSWRRLLLGSFLGTAALFAAWANTYYSEPQLAITFAFATFFFLLFALSPLSGKSPETDRDITTLLTLLNAGAYFAACYSMLDEHYRASLAWLMVATAIFYFALTRVLQRRGGSASKLHAPLTLALGVGFLTVAIPLKLDQYWIELGWLVEAGALFWAAYRSKSWLLRFLGVLALGLGVGRLVFVDSEGLQPLIFNPRFGLYLVAIASLALLAYFAQSEGGEENRQWAAGAILCLNVLALIALHCEVMDYFRPAAGQFVRRADLNSLHTARDFTYSAVWMVYGSGLMLVGFWKKSAFLRWQAIALLALTAAKVFFYDISALERGYRIVAFIVLGGILLAVSFFYQRARVRPAE